MTGSRPACAPSWTRLLSAVAFGVLASSCNQVAESRRIAPLAFTDPGHGGLCQTAFGSYALPKGLLSVTLATTASSAPKLKEKNEKSKDVVSVVRRVDEGFCAHYVTSATSDDQIEIIKAVRGVSITAASLADPRPLASEARSLGSTPFLGAVIANSLDRSADIARRLIRTAFVLASRNPGFAPQGRSDVIRPAERLEPIAFDPFDPDDSAWANSRLTQEGFCVVLEGYSVPGQDIGRYCDNPRGASRQPSRITRSYQERFQQPLATTMPGILYRPRQDYTVAIYRKPDPRGRDPWRLWATETVALENLSPVLSLAISRNIFAGRRAAFLFDEGALVTACLSSTSEIVGFVEIPLEIAHSIVALPASIFSVRLGAAERDRQLLAVQARVLKLQEEIISGKYKPTGTVDPNPETVTSVVEDPSIISDKIAPVPAAFTQAQQEVCGSGVPRAVDTPKL